MPNPTVSLPSADVGFKCPMPLPYLPAGLVTTELHLPVQKSISVPVKGMRQSLVSRPDIHRRPAAWNNCALGDEPREASEGQV